MTYAPNSSCLDAETLAAFTEGRLQGAPLAAVTQHLDACEECTRDVALAMQAVEEENLNVVRPRRWKPWLAAVAAAVVIAVLVPAIRLFRGSPIDRLVEASPRAARIVEPRLAGGFAWAPYHGSQRATENPSSDPARMKLTGVAGELIEQTQHDASAQAQHAAGVAMVLTQNPEEAMARLEKAAATTPSASTWSDLAAARYATASARGRPALYPQALAACDAALRIDPKFTEALFNRALVLERMGLADAARSAWTRYLEADSSSKWADEARVHLAELPAAKQSSEFERVRPLIEDAAARGDAASLRRLLAEHAARARAWAETEVLGRWGEAVLQKQAADAGGLLTIARTIGAAMAGSQGELLLRDSVQAIDDAPASGRDPLAAAHAAYRSGRLAYSRQQLDPALSELARAAKLFDDARSPMALAARYYIAGIHQARHDAGVAVELRQVMQTIDAKPGYRALRAHVRWELGRAYAFDYDWARAIATLSESARLFRDAGDRADEAFVEAILASGIAAGGRGDESWTWRIESFRALSAEGNPARLAGALNGAMRAEVFAGRRDAALALARVPHPVGGDALQLSLVLDALRFESMLESQSGNFGDALGTAQRATVLARGIADPSLRERRLADIDVAIGAASADPHQAIAALTRGIDFYRRIDFPYALPEPLLLRARCALRIGDTPAAARDLDDGMQVVERHRAPAADAGILDADRALFTDAIRLNLDRGDDAAAFAIAERARGAAMTVHELQQRLNGSGTAVLEIVLLDDEVVTFAVSADDLHVVRHRCDPARLPLLGDAALIESGTTAAGALYDELLRPAEVIVSRARHVIVIPDRRLEAVPFAALYDSKRRSYLAERVTVAIAPSARSLQPVRTGTLASIVTMDLPTGGAPALPQADSELAEITTLYRSAGAVAAGQATLPALRKALSSADVVHVAGHTERQPAGGEYALLLAGASGETLERVSSRTVSSTPLTGARLLVLAACETLRPPASTDTHAQSLGSAFAAAGVADVIGTLTPVGDRDARTFFRELHRRIAGGETASDALQSAQIAAIHGGSSAWRSIALLTSRIEASNGKVKT
jgi:tetratricopeptide (TPR) repeat protein